MSVADSLKAQKGSLVRATRYLTRARNQVQQGITEISDNGEDRQKIATLITGLQVLDDQIKEVNDLLVKFEQLAAGADDTTFENDQEQWADLLFDCRTVRAEANQTVSETRNGTDVRGQSPSVNVVPGQGQDAPIIQQIARLATALENQHNSASPTSRAASDNNSGDHALFSKLPKMELTKFKGDILRWTPFWDRFKNSVDKNTKLAPVDKMSYLVGYLEAEPLMLIESLPITDDNYEVAKSLLISKYGDPKMVIALLYRRLNEMKPVKNEPAVLRKFVADIDCLLGGLGALGQDISDDNFATIILSKLPQYVVVMLEMDKDVDTAWTVDLVRGKLNNYLVRLERASKVAALTTKDREGDLKGFTGDSLLAGDEGSKKKQKKQKGERTYKQKQNGSKNDGHDKPICVYCNGTHYSDQCKKYPKADDRFGQLKGRCTVCLSDQHKKRECKSDRPCYYCKMVANHHRSLCFKQFGRNTEPSNLAGDSASPDSKEGGDGDDKDTGLLAADEEVLLQTGQIPVRSASSKNSEYGQRRAFFDPGANRSYCSEVLAKQLGLSTKQGPTLTINRFGSDTPIQVSTRIGVLEVKMLSGRTAKITVSVIPKITGRLVRVPVKSERLSELKDRVLLADKVATRYESSPVDLLIGSDYYLDFITGDKISLERGLYLLGSEFGYIVAGRQPCKRHDEDMSMCGISVGSLEGVVELEPAPKDDPEVLKKPEMTDFWSLEAIGIKDDPTRSEDDVAEESFRNSVKFENDRYTVGLPWNDKSSELESAYKLSVGRLNSLIKKLKNDDNLFGQYVAIIDDQVKKGVIEKVADDSDHKGVHYIPHHAVVQPDRETTKLRVVYDGSAKVQSRYPSLNECLYRGPIMLEDLAGILIRFRTHKYGVIADIEKAFLQININVEDRDKLRFLWLKDTDKRTTEDNLQVYRFSRVPFGLNCSPSLLAQTVHFHLKKIDTPVAEKILGNLYVDNVITGTETVDEAKEFYLEAKEIFRQASMNLRQWTSNSSDLLNFIPKEDQIQSEFAKVLGIKWLKETDQFATEVGHKIDWLAETKREFFSQLSAVFDPLGFFTPVTVTGKVLLQSACESKPKWDTKMEDAVRAEWDVQRKKLTEIDTVRIPRHVPSKGRCMLIAFCDASTSCFATTVYLRCEAESGVHVNLLLSKTHLNPPKKLTVPRLELMGVLIGVRAMNFVSKQVRLSIQKGILFTDSTCVLGWLKGRKKQDLFVKNRVTEIAKSKWIRFRYVNTGENPADWATRGKLASELTEFWWNGPDWLVKPESEWPTWNFEEIERVNAQADSDDGRHLVIHHMSLGSVDAEPEGDDGRPLAFHHMPLIVVPDAEPPFGIDIGRFSSHLKLVRVTAWCQRFASRLRGKFPPGAALNAGELEKSQRMWEVYVQGMAYKDVTEKLDKSKQYDMGQLTLFDDKGLIRCHCRLGNAELPYDQKFPKLLPKGHPYTKLLVDRVHKENGHASVAHTQVILRMEYWVPKLRQLVRSICKGCVTCRKAIGRPFSLPRMPELPQSRVNPKPCFTHTGVDYFGPLKVRGHSTTEKAYVALFTCLGTRAVHLELVSDLSAEEFLAALRRFIARRGKPKWMISDNAPQFKTVSRVTQLAWANILRDESVTSFTANRGITWQFIVEYAPYMGGVYERLVGVVKSCLRKTLGQALLTPRQLETLLFEAESIVNTRPLCYVGADPDEGIVLTPAHFLTLNPRIAGPDLSRNLRDSLEFESPTAEKLADSWRKGQRLLNEFWSQWKKEYLSTLASQVRYAHMHNKGSTVIPKADQIVLLKESNLPRGSWRLAKVSEVHSSPDGRTRSVTVLLPSGKLARRPINLIVPLEVEFDIDAQTESQKDSKSPEDEEESTASGRASPELFAQA